MSWTSFFHSSRVFLELDGNLETAILNISDNIRHSRRKFKNLSNQLIINQRDQRDSGHPLMKLQLPQGRVFRHDKKHKEEFKTLQAKLKTTKKEAKNCLEELQGFHEDYKICLLNTEKAAQQYCTSVKSVLQIKREVVDAKSNILLNVLRQNYILNFERRRKLAVESDNMINLSLKFSDFAEINIMSKRLKNLDEDFNIFDAITEDIHSVFEKNAITTKKWQSLLKTSKTEVLRSQKTLKYFEDQYENEVERSRNLKNEIIETFRLENVTRQKLQLTKLKKLKIDEEVSKIFSDLKKLVTLYYRNTKQWKLVGLDQHRRDFDLGRERNLEPEEGFELAIQREETRFQQFERQLSCLQTKRYQNNKLYEGTEKEQEELLEFTCEMSKKFELQIQEIRDLAKEVTKQANADFQTFSALNSINEF